MSKWVPVFLAACAAVETKQQAQEKALQLLVDSRDERWKQHYAPYVESACRGDREGVRCARAELEAQQRFLDEESRIRAAILSGQPLPKQVTCVTYNGKRECH